MSRLKPNQLEKIAEKIMEWGNLVFVGMVVSQFVPGVDFSVEYAIIGYVALITAYFVATQMMGRGGDKR